MIKGKSEMYTFLKENHKSVFVNLDDEIQNTKTINVKRITFSQNETTANVYIDSIVANPFVKIVTMDVQINSRLIGLYNANNINAAITIGNYFDISTNDIKTAIESYVPENNRSQLLMKSTNEIILDAYNANPSSMNVALDNFIQLDKDNKMVIIGDMYELGQESLEEHKAIVDFLNDNSSFECHFVGKDFFSNKIQNENFHFHKTFDEFAQFLTSIKLENKTLLIKGSRGMALERTLEYL